MLFSILGERRRQRAFELEQRRLAVQPASIAGETAILTQNAVTRHGQAERISPYGSAHCAHGLSLAKTARERAIGRCLALGNAQQRLPDGLLERRSCGEIKWQIELASRASEKLADLLSGFLQHGMLVIGRPNWAGQIGR